MATGKLAKKLLNELSLASGKGGARKELVDQKGQLLVVDSRRFKSILKEIFPRMDTQTQNNIWSAWDTYLKTQVKNIKSKRRLNDLLVAQRDLAVTSTEHSYIISSYETIKKEKSGSGRLGSIVKQYYKKAKQEELSKLGGQGDKFGAQLGHEEGGRGLAASAVKTLKAESALARLGAQDNPQFKEIVQNTKNMLKVSITHEQVLTKKGNLRKKYIPILTWQKAIDNQEAKEAEEAAIRYLEKEFKQLATMEGSTPLVDGVSQVLLANVAPKSNKRTKVVGKRKDYISEKNTSTKGKKTNKRKTTKVVKDSGIDRKSFITKDKSVSSKRSMFSVMAMINRKLPETVEKNMRFPTLENRTGRFARSVKLTDVSTTRQGFPSFGYTYQTDPYQVFEVGRGRAPWATQDRDPRKLIDSSIREVAAEMALGRFYTRRV